MTIRIIIEDHVIPQLLTSAIEAYDFEHRNPSEVKGENRLETIGLLWGYVQPARCGQPPRIVATMATVETSAIRYKDQVALNKEAAREKRDFISKFWPNIELVGTFHTHPYDSRDETSANKGWRASNAETADGYGDEEYWPSFHDDVAADMPYLAHLIVTLTALKRAGTAMPDRFENNTGYKFSIDKRRFWIKGYATENVSAQLQETLDPDMDREVSFLQKNIQLDIPSLERRFV